MYTGKDTKIQMNSIQPPQKVSTMGKWTSRDTMRMFIIDICMCLISAFIGSIMRGNGMSNYFRVGTQDGDKAYMTSMDTSKYGEKNSIVGEFFINFLVIF